MKKITLRSFSVLALASVLVTGCKKTPAVAPVADTETQSAVDASFALYTITDAEMIAAYITDLSLYPKFYMPSATSIGTVTPLQDTNATSIQFSFNQTTGNDGVYRDGSVFADREINGTLYNPHATSNSRYYRTVGFDMRMSLSEYKVDGWRVVTTNEAGTVPVVANVMNLLTTDSWNPAVTNLSWAIKGNFKFIKGTDSIFCKVDLVKTLLNTSTPSVFASNKGSSVNWPKARVSYSGKVSGYTPHNVPFSMEISPNQAIIRDFTCSADPVTGVASTGSVVTTRSNEYHPFIQGVATFTTGTLYPREILYGGSEDADSGQCDNSGAVLIKGIFYPVDFRRK